MKQKWTAAIQMQSAVHALKCRQSARLEEWQQQGLLSKELRHGQHYRHINSFRHKGFFSKILQNVITKLYKKN